MVISTLLEFVSAARQRRYERDPDIHEMILDYSFMSAHPRWVRIHSAMTIFRTMMGPSLISITCWTVFTMINRLQDDYLRISRRWMDSIRNLIEWINARRHARIWPTGKSLNVPRRTQLSIATTQESPVRSSMNTSTRHLNSPFHSMPPDRS